MRIVVPFLALTALAACAAPAPPAPAVSETSRRIDASLVDAGAAAEQRGDYQTAAAYYKGIYERDQGNLEAVLGLSRALRQMGRANESRALVERTIAQRPQDARLLAELGKAQLADDDALEAVESLSKSDALAPGDWEVNSALGVAYDRAGMYEQAERRYRQALEASPDNVTVLNNLGLSLAQSGRLAQGVEALERAVSLPEATPQVRQNLALLYAMNGDMTAAERLVRRDLSGELAERNLAYYRRLAASLKAGEPAALPAPILGGEPAPTAPAVAPKGAAAPQPPVAVAAAPAPAEEKIPPAGAKIPSAGDKIPAARERIPAAGERVAPADRKPAPERAPDPLPQPAPAAPDPEPEASPRSAAEPASPSAAPEPAATTVAAAEPAPSPAAPASADAEPSPASAVPESPAAPGPRGAAEAVASTAGAPEPLESETAAAASVVELPSPQPGPYRVQLGSFPNPDIADLGVGELRELHGDLLGEARLEVVKASLPELGDVYRIVTAPPSDRNAARALCEAVKTRGADCILIRQP